MSKILVAAVALSITRDPMTILPAVVPAHEEDILVGVHGRDNVFATEEKHDPFEIDLTTEGDRLEAKYGGDAMHKAFGPNYKAKIAKEIAGHEVKPAKPAKT